MVNQPYFPEPVQVEGNVAGGRYGEIVRFIRKTMLFHLASALVVMAVSVWLNPVLTLSAYLLVFFLCLLALTILRRALNGSKAESMLSLAVLVPCLWSLGGLARYGLDSGLPVWLLGAGYACAVVYGLVSGRDFSFVGQFVVTTVAVATMLVVCVLAGVLESGEALLWGSATLGYVLYFVYDLAALLSRRRPRESLSAVADLYRDLLNFITYSVRIALHWRRFRFI